MLRETATGIEFLHSLGVVHCDIKPRNILLTGDNQVKVSDMGLSKKLEEEETSFTFSTNAPSGDGGWAPSEVLLCKRKTMKVSRHDLAAAIWVAFFSKSVSDTSLRTGGHLRAGRAGVLRAVQGLAPLRQSLQAQRQHRRRRL